MSGKAIGPYREVVDDQARVGRNCLTRVGMRLDKLREQVVADIVALDMPKAYREWLGELVDERLGSFAQDVEEEARLLDEALLQMQGKVRATEMVIAALVVQANGNLLVGLKSIESVPPDCTLETEHDPVARCMWVRLKK